VQAKPNKTNLEYIHAFHAQPALPCLAICSTTETVVIGFVTSPRRTTQSVTVNTKCTTKISQIHLSCRFACWISYLKMKIGICAVVFLEGV